jgi:hypothetical protein
MVPEVTVLKMNPSTKPNPRISAAMIMGIGRLSVAQLNNIKGCTPNTAFVKLENIRDTH